MIPFDAKRRMVGPVGPLKFKPWHCSCGCGTVVWAPAKTTGDIRYEEDGTTVPGHWKRLIYCPTCRT